MKTYPFFFSMDYVFEDTKTNFFEDMRTDDGEKKDNAYLFENMKIMSACGEGIISSNLPDAGGVL